MAGPRGFTVHSQLQLLLSVGWESPEQEELAMSYLTQDYHLRDPAFQHFQTIARLNITLRPLRLVSRRVVETSEYHAVRKGLGIEDMLFSQRGTTNQLGSFSISPQRPPRDPCFNARSSKLLRLLHDELALLVGNVLSDGHPNPLANLSPRPRQTLMFLLSGDSEKQVALRMGISRHTVHEYVVAIYKHFRVSSRAELLALCWQRGIGGPAGPRAGGADAAVGPG
jgi:DNA-binding CsgD family transcriptional regulator